MAETTRLIVTSSNTLLYLLPFVNATHGLTRYAFQAINVRFATWEKRDDENS